MSITFNDTPTCKDRRVRTAAAMRLWAEVYADSFSVKTADLAVEAFEERWPEPQYPEGCDE